MQRPQIYFDEDVPGPLAELLRNAGITVHRPSEMGTLSAQDPIHLQTSVSQGWVLLTQNRRHFRRLHWLWMTFHYWGIISQPHSGILTVYQQVPDQLGEWAEAILEMLQEQSVLSGLMYMWRPSERRWESEPVDFM